MSRTPAAPPLADDLVDFLNASPSPFHAVAECARRLSAAGFVELRDADDWQIERPFYLTRGGSTIAAVVPGTRSPSESGLRIIAAHTDSPNLRLKPRAEFERHGYRQLGVEVYGGVLLSTWMDRELSAAGRLALRSAQGEMLYPLLDLERPLAIVPNLAIHLNREVNSAGLVLNRQEHLPPVYALSSFGPQSWTKLLQETLTAGQGIEGEILAWDLGLYEARPAQRIGVQGEFIASGRIDNLASCHAAIQALSASGPRPESTQIVVCYDHEECGSRSAKGAASTFLATLIERVLAMHEAADRSRLHRVIARSLLVSLDMAHGVHPNYAERHDAQHRPQLGAGPVIKVNVNQSYASDAETQSVFAECCREAGVSPQSFVVRSDLPCGSTVGPILAAALGIRSVDVGNPMLAMHSCRELCAAADVEPMVGALKAFLKSRLS